MTNPITSNIKRQSVGRVHGKGIEPVTTKKAFAPGEPANAGLSNQNFKDQRKHVGWDSAKIPSFRRRNDAKGKPLENSKTEE